jgi:uncharacterized protein (TIGR02996 family)
MTQTILTTGDVMLREIIANPHDKVLRSIYADWLEEVEQCLPGGQLWPWRVDLIRWGGNIRLVRLGDKTTHSSSVPAYLSGSAIQLSGGLVWRHRGVTEVEYRHGFIEVIKAPFEVLVKGLPTWVTEYPLVEVEVSDLEPWDENECDPEGDNKYGWWESSMNPDADRKGMLNRGSGPKVFQAIWDSAEGYEHADHIGRWLLFDTKEDAVKALSDTLLDMARKGTL